MLAAIVVGGGGSTLALHSIQRQHEDALAASVFLSEAEDAVAGFQDALRRSATLPKTAAAVIRVLPKLDIASWRRFVVDLRPFDTAPGLVGYGVAQPVTADGLDALAARMLREGQGSLRLFPRGLNGTYWPVVYAEPDIVAKQARGFDLASEPARRKAIDQAVDSGDASMTGLIKVGFTDEPEKPPGFLLFYPLYGGDRMPSTPEERRAALTGVTLAVYRLDQLIEDLVGPERTNRVLSLYDMEGPTPQLAFRSSKAAQVSDQAFRERVNFAFGGHAWRLDIAATPEYVGRIDRQRSTGIFLVGLLFTLAGAALLHMLDSGRLRAEQLAHEMTDELRRSEERFRSLTSLTSDWYWEQDDQYRFTSMSQGFARHNFAAETVVGKRRWELPIDLTPAQWAIHRADLEARRPFQDLEYRIAGNDGLVCRARQCSGGQRDELKSVVEPVI